MKEIISDAQSIAYCGLYCGACKAYLRERCPGCHDNEKATWCRIRLCCINNQYSTCADCRQFTDPNDCRIFNNLISRIFSVIFRSNRAACIRQIQDIGIQGHADRMAELKSQSIQR
jgi:hypothetical protein